MAVCIDCNVAERKRYYSENPNKKSEANRKAQLKKYGITPEEYNSLFTSQMGCCAGCGIHQSKYNKRLSVDHDHITHKVRGLLCQGCNSVLGYAFEQVSTLKSLIKYLETHKSELAEQTNIVEFSTIKRVIKA